MTSIKEQIALAMPYLRRFEDEYKVRLLETKVIFEEGAPEPMYVFSDNLGGYTLPGILDSLGMLQDSSDYQKQ